MGFALTVVLIYWLFWLSVCVWEQMGRGGKVSGKGNFRKRARSEEAGSDDSDEDYVISDEDYSSSLDGFVSEESFDSFMEEEDEEFPRVRKFNRSKAKNGTYGQRKNASKTSRKRGRIAYEEEEEEENEEEEEEEEEEEKEVEVEEEEKDEDKDEEEVQVEEEKEEEKEKDEDGEEEIQGRNFNRSNAKNGVCGQQKNASTTSTKRGRIAYAEQLEEDEEEEEEEEENEKDKEEKAEEKDKEEEKGEKDKDEEEDEEEKVETEGDDEDEEGEEELGDEWKEEEEKEGDGDEEDEDFDYDDDDDEFTPEEDDYSDEEEQMRGRKKKNNGMKMGKKVRRASVVSTRGRKKRSSRASKKPLRKKRRKNGGLRRNVKSDDEDDFIDNGPAIRTACRKKRGWKRRRVLLSDSDSDCVSSGSSDVEYTISEEEREQMREANELWGGLKTNLRSSSLLIKNEEDGVHEDLHQKQTPPGRKGKEKVEEPQGRKGKEKVEDLKTEVVKQVCGICLSEEDKRRVRGVLNCCTHYFCFACIMEWAEVESRCPLCKQRFNTISKPARSTTGIDLREVVMTVPERDQVFEFYLL